MWGGGPSPPGNLGKMFNISMQGVKTYVINPHFFSRNQNTFTNEACMPKITVLAQKLWICTPTLIFFYFGRSSRFAVPFSLFFLWSQGSNSSLLWLWFLLGPKKCWLWLKMQGFGSEFRFGSGRICNHLGLWIRIQIQGYPSNNKWVSLCVLYSYIQACIKFQDFWFSSSHHEIFFSFSSTFCNMGLWIKIWGKQFLLYTFINVCLRCMCSAGLKTVNIWFLLLTTYYNVVL